jgi:tetratricopeptide (TPR) repeat protein
MRQLCERRPPRQTVRGLAAAQVALALVLVAVAAAPAVAQATWEDADRLQREAVDRWVARDFVEADRLYGEAIDAFDAVGDRHMTAFALSNRASVRLNLGRWDAAAADARRADGLFAAAIAELDPRASGASDTNSPLNLARRGRVAALGALRTAALEQGRLPEAERRQREQIALWEEVGDENPTGLASGYEGLAEIAERAGRHAEAAEHYDLAAALWQRSGEIYASDFIEQRRRASLAGAQAARRHAATAAAESPARPAPRAGAPAIAVSETARSETTQPSETRRDSEPLDAAAPDTLPGTALEDRPVDLATATTAPEVPAAVQDIVRLVGRALDAVGSLLVPLVFGSVVLLVIVKSAQQKKRARAAVLQHRAMDAQGRARTVIQSPPPRDVAARPRAPASSGGPAAATDLPPPVVGGAGRAVIEHKGTGWCGCIALVVLIAGLVALTPWLLRTLDVL